MSRDPLAAPSAVVFDLDGLLIDTEESCFQTAVSVVRRHSGGTAVPSRDEYGAFVGHPLEESWATLRERYGLALTLDELLAEREMTLLQSYSRPEVLPGAAELVEHTHAAGLSLAIASGASRTLVDIAARALPFGHCFSAVVSADHPGVSAPKPAPDAYLVACELLGVETSDATAIEDSPAGAQAALAAGLATIVVPNEFTRDRRFPGGVVRHESLFAVLGELDAQAA